MDGTDLVGNSQDSILMFKKAFVPFLFGQSKYSRGFLRADSSTTSPYRLARSGIVGPWTNAIIEQ